jgi:hypothetical protein
MSNKSSPKKIYEDITYQNGSYEGIPITDVMTIAEQKEIEAAGLDVSDVIDMNIASERDWQCDC